MLAVASPTRAFAPLRGAVGASRARRTMVVRAEQYQPDRVRDEVTDKEQATANSTPGGLNTGGNKTVENRIENTLDPRILDVNEAFENGVGSFGRLMKFNGIAPELINGRLAMTGFTAALGAEIATGENIFEQFKTAPGLVIGASLLLIAASFVPLLRGGTRFSQGPTTDSRPIKSSGFSIANELINSRAAMVGFAILLGYEAWSGHSIFTPWFQFRQ